MSETSYVCKLTDTQSKLLRERLVENSWEIDQVPYSNWRARKAKTSVTSYESGKLCAQGKGTQELVQMIIEPYILKEARLGYEVVLTQQENPEMFTPHAGIDESGKGDYFGPLVISCLHVNENTAAELLELGVRDSKMIRSWKKVQALTKEIRRIVRGEFSVIAIGPEAYNRMYAKIANLNRLLAWGHARALENLLEKVPDCQRAISDQFGRKSTVTNALMERGKKIRLEQRPKAEADIAVAAASIIARHEFVRKLEEIGEKLDIELPKGASSKVLDVATTLAAKHGSDILTQCAKTHFKLTEQVRERVRTGKSG